MYSGALERVRQSPRGVRVEFTKAPGVRVESLVQFCELCSWFLWCPQASAKTAGSSAGLNPTLYNCINPK